MERRESDLDGRRTTDVTDSDILRIHDRLDDIVEMVQKIEVAHESTRGQVEALVKMIAKSEATRQATCPQKDNVTRMAAELRILRFLGAVVVAALLIPGLQWMGQRLLSVIIGA